MRKVLFALTLIPVLLQDAPARSEVVVKETETGIYVEIVGTPGPQATSAPAVTQPAAADTSWELTLLRQREEVQRARKEARRLQKEQEPEEKDEIE